MALDTYALTSLANLKTHIGETGSSNDTELENHINRASAAIEAYCDRQFVTRERVEWHSAGSGCISTKHWPIINLRVLASGRRQALTITLSSSGYIAGTVTVKHTPDATASGILIQRVATDGTTTNSPTLFANYATTALMAAQLTAAVPGITASAAVNVPCRYLVPTAGRDILSTTQYLDAAEPVSGNVDVNEASGVVSFDGDPWFIGGPTLLVYEAGYAAAPADVEDACIRLAARGWIGKRSDTGTTLGDYRDPYDIRTLQEEYGSILAQWKRVR